jgi:MFS family permease
MSASLLRRNLRLCTYDGLVATPLVYLLQPGNFIIAALLTGLFRIPADTYGLIVSLPFWANFAQAFMMPVLNSRLSPKIVSVASSSLQAACWATLAVVIAFLPLNDPHLSGRWFLSLLIVSAGVSAFTGVSWTSWVQEWVPTRLRGKYFGQRNRLLQLSQIIFLLSTGWVLDRFAGRVIAFQGVILVGVVLRLASVFFQRRIQSSTTSHTHPEAAMPWRAQLAHLTKHTPFKRLVAYGAAWGFSANLFGPFYPVFMYNVLHLSVPHVGFLVILASLGGVLSYPAWGAISDRFGNKPVMLFCMIAWQLQNFLWCALVPSNAWLLYPMWVFGGAMGAGFALSLFNLQLKIIPPAAKTIAISVNLAIASVVTATAPIIGGFILQALLARGLEPLNVYHGVFLAQPIIALSACLLLARVHEPAASPLASVVGAMRNIRTLSSVFGLNFFVDYVFVQPVKKNRPHACPKP